MWSRLIPLTSCRPAPWSVDARAFDMLTLSLSTFREDMGDRLYVTCEAFRRAGTVVVAAAYNGFDAGYPAVVENVIGVSLADGPLADAVPFAPRGSGRDVTPGARVVRRAVSRWRAPAALGDELRGGFRLGLCVAPLRRRGAAPPRPCPPLTLRRSLGPA